MKKFSYILVGMIAGVVLSLSVTAYADNIKSLIGKVVKNEAVVKVNGKEVEKKAVVIDGSSFLPVRAFSDATGYSISFSEQGDILLDKKGDASLSTETAIDPNNVEKRTITGVIGEIEQYETAIHGLQLTINRIELDIKNDTATDIDKADLIKAQDKVKEFEPKLEALKIELSELKTADKK